MVVAGREGMREDGRELIEPEMKAEVRFRYKQMRELVEESMAISKMRLGVEFKGLGKRAMEILKQAPMNR